jgi:hypothetical protein
MPSQAPIHIAPMPHSANGHDLLCVINAIQNPVVTYAQGEAATSAPDAFDPARPGIVGQRRNADIDAPEDLPW